MFLKTVVGRSRSHTVVIVAESMNSCSVLMCCRGERDFNERDSDSLLWEETRATRSPGRGLARDTPLAPTSKPGMVGPHPGHPSLSLKSERFWGFWATLAVEGPLFPDGSGDLS